jgi:hypothetical protein
MGWRSSCDPCFRWMIPVCLEITRRFYTAAQRPDGLLQQEFAQASQYIASNILVELRVEQRAAIICLLADILPGYVHAVVSLQDSKFLAAIKRAHYSIAVAHFSDFTFVQKHLSRPAYIKRQTEQNLYIFGCRNST